ncbi:hypothetical protein [Rubritalea tangerina]|uniref:DUF202 domain-containing protein n=1 Tax=Rubritalea tangerina TaxID=430798 RepID=A0ABW4ZC25_9BACT
MDTCPEATKLALDLSKQLITLSTGSVALSITFFKDVITNNQHKRAFLYSSWILFALTLVVGLLVHMTITGRMAQASSENLAVALAPDVRIVIGIQILFFICAILSFITYAIRNLRGVD